MPTRTARIFSAALVLSDFLTLLVAFVLAYLIRVQSDSRPLLAQVPGITFLGTSLWIIPFWILSFASLGLYGSSVYTRRVTEIGKLFLGCIVGILLMLGFAFIVKTPIFPARLVAVYAFIGSYILVVLSREIMRQIRTALFRYNIGISNVLLVGTSGTMRDIAVELNNTRRSGYKVIAIVGPRKCIPENFDGIHYLSLEKALRTLSQCHITTIVQTDLYEDAEKNQQILQATQSQHINYSFIPGEPEFYSGKNTVDVFLGYPIISVHQTPLVGWGETAKRIFDIIFSLLAILLLSPVFLLLIILQKLFNPGPIFYTSKRLTRYAKEFGLIKFRTMRPEFGGKDAADEFRAMGREDLAIEYEKYRKVRNDPRITSFGHFLRATSLDELPQFFNALKGDLSLVGPRPILPQELHFYKGRGALLHSVKSGVTGLWQVSGRSELSFDQRVELELYYAQNWSFLLDLKIILKTLPTILRKTGAR